MWGKVGIQECADPGMRGMGTTRVISPAGRVFVLVMVNRVPELWNMMLLLESVLCEMVSSEGGTKFAVRKNVKKPTGQADPKG